MVGFVSVVVMRP